MAIDSATKRKSVINNGIPALALLPMPDGLIQAIDRRRLADFYSLGSQVISRNFWVPDRRDSSIAWDADARSTTSWAQEKDASTEFAQDKRTSTDWVQDKKSDGEWTEEMEVPVE